MDRPTMPYRTSPSVFAAALGAALIAGCGGGGDHRSSTNTPAPITFVPFEGVATNATLTPLTNGATTYTTTGSTFTANVTVTTPVSGGSRVVSVTIDPSAAVDGIVGLGGTGNVNSALYFESPTPGFGNSWHAVSGTVTILKRTGTEISLRLDNVRMEADPSGLFNASTGSFTLNGDVRK